MVLLHVLSYLFILTSLFITSVGARLCAHHFNWQESIIELEANEQVCVWGSNRAVREDYLHDLAKGYRLQLIDLRSSFNEVGIDLHAKPNYELSWMPFLNGDEEVRTAKLGVDNFIQLFEQSDQFRKCDLLNAAYYFALLHVNGLLAGRNQDQIGSQIMFPDHPYYLMEDEVARDRQRAAWAFRYIAAVSSEEVPLSCRQTYLKGIQRFRFVFDHQRPPLGYMLEACGRAQNAHYLDESVNRGIIPAPDGWNNPVLLGGYRTIPPYTVRFTTLSAGP